LLFVIEEVVSKDLYSLKFHNFSFLVLFCVRMAKGTNKQFSILSTRQITHTRLYDDGSLETRYEVLNKLGEGSFGTVYRVKNKETNLFYAMKTIAKKVKYLFYVFF
jgi:serine/threonine protein kinase